MIARVWRGVASPEDATYYIAHFNRNVLPELKCLSGFETAYIFQHPMNDGIELTVMTLWQSLDAIRSFAGEDYETAVVAPTAQAVLLSFDKHVTHYEVIMKGSNL